MSSPKKRKNKSSKPSRDIEVQSETSFGTVQLQEKASRSTENVFSQMLSRSK
jgi:hypothetical protein